MSRTKQQRDYISKLRVAYEINTGKPHENYEMPYKFENEYVLWLEERLANGVEQSDSNCNIPFVSGSALLTDLLNKQKEIVSSPIRFNGISTETLKEQFARYGINYKEPF